MKIEKFVLSVEVGGIRNRLVLLKTLLFSKWFTITGDLSICNKEVLKSIKKEINKK